MCNLAWCNISHLSLSPPLPPLLSLFSSSQVLCVASLMEANGDLGLAWGNLARYTSQPQLDSNFELEESSAFQDC